MCPKSSVNLVSYCLECQLAGPQMPISFLQYTWQMKASSSDFQALWRPQLHVVGTIAWGYCECYYIMNSDIAKDANMECTVVSRTLDIVAAVCAEQGRGLFLTPPGDIQLFRPEHGHWQDFENNKAPTSNYQLEKYVRLGGVCIPQILPWVGPLNNTYICLYIYI